MFWFEWEFLELVRIGLKFKNYTDFEQRLPEQSEQSKQWIEAGKSALKKAKTVPRARPQFFCDWNWNLNSVARRPS